MPKQTKNIITRETLEKELRHGCKAGARFSLTVSGALSVVFVPLTIGLVSLIWMTVGNTVMKILLSVLLGGLMTSPIWALLLNTVLCFKEMKLLDRGDFDVVTLELLRKSEIIVHRHLEEVLHFNGFKKKSVDHTVYQLASPGDEFYIVHFKGSREIRLLYPLKMYEYKSE